MSARPIMMSAPMVRALLEGRKTQTRRVVKPQPDWEHPEPCCSTTSEGWQGPIDRATWAESADPETDFRRCPYGGPGDRLWVREAFAHPNDQVTIYRANWREDAEARGLDNIPADDSQIRWRPSIHMPNWASRLTLTITDVRVERLQDISEADAAAEGVEPPATEREDHDWSICSECGGTGLHAALGPNLGVMEVDCIDCDTSPKRLKHLWNHINGPDAWDANPWVWALTFSVETPNAS